MRFAHTPQVGELWAYKHDPSKMVLVLAITHGVSVLTKPLYNDGKQGYRNINTFRTMWRPVIKETQ